MTNQKEKDPVQKNPAHFSYNELNSIDTKRVQELSERLEVSTIFEGVGGDLTCLGMYATGFIVNEEGTTLRSVDKSVSIEVIEQLTGNLEDGSLLEQCPKVALALLDRIGEGRKNRNTEVREATVIALSKIFSDEKFMIPDVSSRRFLYHTWKLLKLGLEDLEGFSSEAKKQIHDNFLEVFRINDYRGHLLSENSSPKDKLLEAVQVAFGKFELEEV
jgi:hypothetical protein